MRKKSYSFVLFILVLVVGMTFITTVSPANSSPELSKAIRPTVDPGNGGGGNGGGGGGTGGDDGNGDGNDGSSQLRCASLTGQVINWGFGPQEGVEVALQTGSWQAAATSASDGNYGLGGLGVGVARLRVTLPPGPDETLDPLAQEAGVYLNCDFPTIANIALVSNEEIDPPATIEMSAPNSLSADSQTPVRITVKNNLPNEITNVIVTSLMPPGLIPLEVATATADPQNTAILDGGDVGRLAVAYLDRLASGDEANIIVTLTAAEDVPSGTQLTNTATLFFRESVAVQDSATFTIGPSAGVAPQAAATTADQVETPATAEPAATPVPAAAATPEAAATEEAAEAAFQPPPGDMPTTGGDELIPPGSLPVTGDDAYPPPALLPQTGLKLTAPLLGIGLVGLAFVAHLLRTSWQREE